jgi:4a-hydroxytetrahydrobiopterin dehydratase
MAIKLVEKKCVPCSGGTPPLKKEKIEELQKEVEGWEVKNNKAIDKTFVFKTFREAIDFVNEVANIAEDQHHHPDIHIHYKKVMLEFTTHAIQGLSENDFIMASKIDMMYGWQEKVEKVVVKKLFSIRILFLIVIILLVILLLKT